MKSIAVVCAFVISQLIPQKSGAQCTFSSPYGSATINNTTPGYSVTITTCQWAGEVATLNFNVTGAFSFSSSNVSDYITLTNSTNSVIAFGPSPLNAVIPTTGTYYLHLAASGPPNCNMQSSCRTTRVYVPFPPCSGMPQTGTPYANPTVICPNTSATISLAGVTTGTGLFYQWLSSTTGSAGLYGVVPGASLSVFNTPTTATGTTWYRAIVACANSGQSATSTPISIDIAGTTTNSVPYFEGFESLVVDNQLPNCSWVASNMPQTCQTYVNFSTNNRIPRTGSKFASFYYLPAGSSSFYTNGIQLNAGVTYSASAWFTTEANTYTNWSNLSLLIGPNQSTIGMQSVASTSGTAASPVYKSLSNTFTVAASGIYYMAIRATSNGQCCAQYLSVDDIEITAPCSLNAPLLNLSTTSTAICQGNTTTITANGADTYVWSNGSTSSSVVVSPFLTTTYTITGIHAASSCSSSVVQQINVYPMPDLAIVANTLSICQGETLALNVVGALSYTWNSGFMGNPQVVGPLATTVYSVIGSNGFCEDLASVTVTVHALPNVSAVSSNTEVSCAGEAIVLTGSGANTYTWSSNYDYHIGNPITVYPDYNTTYTVIGKNLNGCVNTNEWTQYVNACVGLKDQSFDSSGIRVFPNPGFGDFTLQLGTTETRLIRVCDISGRSLKEFSTDEKEVKLPLNELHAGVYLITISNAKFSTTLQVIKH